MSETHTWLYNPETDAKWECPNDVVGFYLERRGWEHTDPPEDDIPEHLTGFNPADHKAAEVLEHIAANQDSPGEIERVVELERVGQNRKSIVGDSAAPKE